MTRTEKRRVYNSEYRRKNRERLVAKDRRYYAENKEARSAKDKLYRQTNAAKIAERRKGYESRTKAKRREYNLRAYYKVSAAEYDRMVSRQAGLCAICTQPMKPGSGTHLDHCHKTGKLRAMLCSNCNVGIGFFQDDSAVARAAADYLESHNG